MKTKINEIVKAIMCAIALIVNISAFAQVQKGSDIDGEVAGCLVLK